MAWTRALVAESLAIFRTRMASNVPAWQFGVVEVLDQCGDTGHVDDQDELPECIGTLVPGRGEEADAVS